MIAVLLADGFEEIEAIAFVDILRRAQIEVETVSISDQIVVTGAHNIPVVANITLDRLDIRDLEAVVLPGGGEGTERLKQSEAVSALLHSMQEENKLIGAICAAPSVLGGLGLLNGKTATCYPGFEVALIGATVANTPVVQDGNIITSRGAGTAHEFAFAFVGRLKGTSLANEIRAAMQYE